MTFSNFTIDNLRYFGLGHYILLTDEVNNAKIVESLNNKYISIDNKNQQRKLLDERAAYKLELAKRKDMENCDNDLESVYGNSKNKNNKNKLLETIKRNKDIDKEI